MAPINPGTFVLHSRAVPDLPAGEYTVAVEQSFTAPGATPERLDTRLEVTAPRYGLPPDQVLSTFPPNRSEGAFSARLPQIVLKRRTLPWERRVAAPEVPWLALVVLADAEAEFRQAQPIAQCVTPGVTLAGRNDTEVGDTIVVTATVVRRIFPTKTDLPLLSHVRQVDLSDTELGLGDDDGYLAVVLSNRLPQPGVRYRACLISLEGQYGLLPDTAEIEPDPATAFISPFVYPTAALATDETQLKYAKGSAGTGNTVTIADGWSTTGFTATWNAPVTKTAALIGDMHAVDLRLIVPDEPTYRFPVLAHWQFTCVGASDFQSLMQHLDVGMLGTLPAPPPPPEPGRKPPPPRTRAAPEVLDTGHVTLAHTSRAGETGSAWYRGPFVPRPVARPRPDASGRLPLLHASDQARRVGPDGRLNLSIAAAFEIGRLLALAEPNVVAALVNWRKEGFETSRRTELIATDPLLERVGNIDKGHDFAVRAGRHLLAEFGRDGAARLGAVRLPTDPGCPIEGVDGLDTVTLIADGFGLPRAVVKDLIEPRVKRGTGVVVPVAERGTSLEQVAERAEVELAPLLDAAFDLAAAIAVDLKERRS